MYIYIALRSLRFESGSKCELLSYLAVEISMRNASGMRWRLCSLFSKNSAETRSFSREELKRNGRGLTEPRDFLGAKYVASG